MGPDYYVPSTTLLLRVALRERNVFEKKKNTFSDDVLPSGSKQGPTVAYRGTALSILRLYARKHVLLIIKRGTSEMMLQVVTSAVEA